MVPVIETLLKVTVDPALLVLVTVTVCPVLVVPTLMLPNERLLGDKVTVRLAGVTAVTWFEIADSPEELEAVTT